MKFKNKWDVILSIIVLFVGIYIIYQLTKVFGWITILVLGILAVGNTYINKRHDPRFLYERFFPTLTRKEKNDHDHY